MYGKHFAECSKSVVRSLWLIWYSQNLTQRLRECKHERKTKKMKPRMFVVSLPIWYHLIARIILKIWQIGHILRSKNHSPQMAAATFEYKVHRNKHIDATYNTTSSLNRQIYSFVLGKYYHILICRYLLKSRYTSSFPVQANWSKVSSHIN